MRRLGHLGVFGVVLTALVVAVGLASITVHAAGLQGAAAAAKASPELISSLSKAIGGTPEQAAGAAGALLNTAKGRLKPDEWLQVARAVPGVDALISAAPPVTGAAATAATGLAGATASFTKLGLKPDMVAKAVPVLTQFVSKSGGATAGKLLSGALK